MSLMSLDQIEGIRQNGTKLIVTAVCTYKRPKMLRACLDSLASQELPANSIMHLVVVDNDPNRSARAVYDEWCRFSPLWSDYLCQPKRGIPFARNAAIEHALQLKADYLAFIDDDETAHSSWAASLLGPAYDDVDILGGQQVITYGDDIPEWARPRPRKEPLVEGQELTCAFTNNIRFSRAMLEAGLRFDESIGMGGGSDSELCRRAISLGFSCRYTAKAITWEAAHPERFTIRAQMERIHRINAGSTKDSIKLRGLPRVLPRILAAELTYPFKAGFYLCTYAALYLFAREKANRHLLRAARTHAKAKGLIDGLRGYIPQVYENTVGS